MRMEGLSMEDAASEAQRLQEIAGSKSPSREDLDAAQKQSDKENRTLFDLAAICGIDLNDPELFNPERYLSPDEYPSSFVDFMIRAKETLKDKFLAPFPQDVMLKKVDRGLQHLLIEEGEEGVADDLSGKDPYLYPDLLEKVINQNLPFTKEKAIAGLRLFIQQETRSIDLFAAKAGESRGAEEDQDLRLRLRDKAKELLDKLSAQQ